MLRLIATYYRGLAFKFEEKLSKKNKVVIKGLVSSKMSDSDKSFSAVLVIVLLGSLLATSAAIISNVTAIQKQNIAMLKHGKTRLAVHQHQGISENKVKDGFLTR